MKLLSAVLLLFFSMTLCGQMPVEEFNRLWGMPLLGGNSGAWEFPACSERLQQKRIRLQRSPGRHSAFLHGRKVLGSSCQELVILTDRQNRQIEAVELVFANKGDVAKRTKLNIRRANKNLKEKLTAAFGEPENVRIGSGSRKQQNKVDLWRCSFAEIILDTEKDEYCQVVIRPPRAARTESDKRIDPDALVRNVKRNDFGDVYITGIPMVDQGMKGYCAVATAARVMLYFGIKDFNQHKLADEAGADREDGTNVRKLKNALKAVRKTYGLKSSGSYKVDMKYIARYIDMGVPVFWWMYSTASYNRMRRENSSARMRAASPREWKIFLRHQKKIRKTADGSHICLIVGYNELTDEIAVSNSWGADENIPSWVPLRAAEAVNIDSFVFHP